ncbi:MAG: large-conductance mechanosensitive channel protein MscL [Erysipelotrichaceae bacterium]|nr:large-conductance mechanosensitive channel protein MscL [Erysipelotrichaceae bacterium]
MLNEFKEFAFKGNVIDLAVGVIIGSAFGKIVSSLVADIIMPLIGVLLGGYHFTDLSLHLAGESYLLYGNFLQNIFDFLIIAICIFAFVKAINKLERKKAAEPEAPKGPSTEELLTEIRDLLKNK